MCTDYRRVLYYFIILSCISFISITIFCKPSRENKIGELVVTNDKLINNFTGLIE